VEQQPDPYTDLDSATESLLTGLGEEAGSRQAKVRQALESVKSRVQPATWTAFELTTLENLSGKEAAEQTGLSVASVHVARSRVAAMLRKELASLGVEA
jgi:DNA-directed RNA polymerase specialized sigma24 family protein